MNRSGPAKVYGTSKLEEMRQFEKKIRQNLKMILNGRLSEQQLKTEIIYRKGARSLVYIFKYIYMAEEDL